MEELENDIAVLTTNIVDAARKLDLEGKVKELAGLAQDMEAPGFWDDNLKAAQVSRRRAHLEANINKWQGLLRQAKDLGELAGLKDGKLTAEIATQHQQLKQAFEAAEFELKLNGPHDHGGAILSIHAGAGGVDAQDWAAMLLRMYLRWAEAHELKATIISQSSSEEAGIKSATLSIEGPLAYGRLRGEHGVHRLVRKSPFNADNLRQTSFALVEVLPQLEEADEVELDPKALKIDVFRSGGAGGQSVNTTDSAVRITHLPTGLSVSIQNERSQLQNRQTALKILQAKLVQLQTEQQAAELSKLKGPNIKAEWGRQIRNYVLDPYQLVKDVRSGHETNQTDAVLNGELDEFIEAYLGSQIGAKDKG